MDLSEITDKYAAGTALLAEGKFAECLALLAPYVDDTMADKEMVANIRYSMGMCHWRMGQFDEAVHHFLIAQRWLKELRSYKKLPSVKNSLGLIFRKSGHFRDGLVQFIEGLFYAFQLEDKNSMIALTCNIALAMQEMGDWERAMRGYDAALQLCMGLPDSIATNDFKCKILLNKCLILYSFGQVRREEVLDYLAQVQYIIDHHDVGFNLAEIEILMAHSYIQIEEYAKAYNILKDKDISDAKAITSVHAINMLSQAIIHKHLHHDEAAFLQMLDKVSDIATEYKMLHVLLSIHQVLQKHYESVGDKKLTAFHSQTLKKIQEDSVKDQEIGYLNSILEANLDAVENKSRSTDQIEDLLSEHDFLINNYSYQHRKIVYHVPLRDIVYVEVKGDYLSLYTISDSAMHQFTVVQAHKMRKPLKDFVSEINKAEAYFVRIHGSFIVNLYWVSKFPQKNISKVVIADTELTVSDTYRPAFKEKLNGFLAARPA